MKKILVLLMLLIISSCETKENEISGQNNKQITVSYELKTKLTNQVDNNLHNILYEYDYQEVEEIEYTFTELTSDVNKRQENIYNSKVITNTESYVHDHDSGRYPPLTAAEASKLMSKSVSKKTSLTKEAAINDAITLDKLYVYTYGPYEYYGGDDVFKEAHNKVLDEINNYGNDSIPAEEFNNILNNAYYFIKDDHSSIGDTKAYRIENEDFYLNMFYLDNYYIYQDTLGYYTMVNNSKWYLESVNGDSVEDNIFVSVDDTGKLCYILGHLSYSNNENLSLDVSFTNKQDSFDLEVVLTKMTSLRNSTNDMHTYSFTVEDNVPIITLRTMSSSGGFNKKHFESFENAGTLMQDEDLLIVDIRSNGGGNSMYSKRFYKNLLEIEDNFGGMPFDTKSYDYFIGNETTKKAYNMEEFLVNSHGTYQSDDTIKFVLMDKSNGSAGEHAVFDARAIENTIVVGSNSNGKTLTGNTIKFTLPESGIPVNLATRIVLFEEDSYIDGVGIMPDIWLEPSETLDKTLALVDYYDLGDNELNNQSINDNLYGKADFNKQNTSNKEIVYSAELETKTVELGSNNKYLLQLDLIINGEKFKDHTIKTIICPDRLSGSTTSFLITEEQTSKVESVVINLPYGYDVTELVFDVNITN